MTDNRLEPAAQHQAHLSPWDGMSIIVGIVVGTSIFKSTSLIFGNVSGPLELFGVWIAGGVLSFIGALCYAELATTYPFVGGDYAYLKRAFGGFVAFMFGWSQLAASLTGSIGTMAFAFADYGVAFSGGQESAGDAWLAALAIAVLTVANVLGARAGSRLQNILSVVKIAGLVALVALAVFAGGEHSLSPSQPVQGPGFGLAMILVLYTYGGWNDAAFVAAEVRHPERNIPRVLLGGIALILAIYLVVNCAYLWALGFDGARQAGAPAAEVAKRIAGPWGGKAISLLVMISALGAINGLLVTGSRVYASMGADHSLFAFLKRWDPRLNTPVWSLITSGVVAVAMTAVVGTAAGRGLVDQTLMTLGAVSQPLPWSDYGGGFNTLVTATAPVFWGFFLLTGLSLIVLRFTDPQRVRPFRVPLFPLEPLLFCGMCGYMLYAAIDYAKYLSLIGLLPVALGAPLYFLGRRTAAPQSAS
ncbi:MAG: amino acid permease [Pirellulales bacterium]